jgi:acyl carrier protein
MGLDGVELVMEFEDEFELRIPDQAVSEMFTVGDTVRYLVDELNKRKLSESGNAAARSFYRLRNELMIRYGVARDAVRPDTPIGQLIPKNARHDWPSIVELSGLRGERRRLFRRRFPVPETPIRTLIENRCKTPWLRLDGTIDEEVVFRRVQQIVAEQMNLPSSSIRRESKYVQDLGIG